MPPKKKKKTEIELVQAIIDEQGITETLITNYMPYAMSDIVSRAIPEIDGFKPSHRKLLYTMYTMGLLRGKLTKSANIVGTTMKLNPHGDSAIYETMVRLTEGNGALLHPFIESKGNFGKSYSRDMAYAASRYTEAKLASFAEEIFRDIDADPVDFVPNYDNTLTEPTLLPTSFPNILVNPNQGIAVSMASSFCGFNLEEICKTTIELIKNPQHDLLSTLSAPDFPTGGELIYNRAAMEKIYETGRGSFRVRSKWRYEQKGNLIEIYEIPYTTSVEAIMDKAAELIKAGKIREISDMRDETDLSGLKIAIDLKRGVDAEKFMQKMFRLTPLEDSFSCNFNVLIAGSPIVLGVRALLNEWIAWRTECIRRKTKFELGKKSDRLHLLKGLAKILLDIDRAIEIIRNTSEESEVIPNLMIGFGIDELQAEFVAEIRLRNINKEYILRRVSEVETLEDEIADLKDLASNERRLRSVIVKDLNNICKKYAQPRRTTIIAETDIEEEQQELEQIPDYPVHIFLSREGYFKKITPQSLRMSGEQKLKEGDVTLQHFEAKNSEEIIFLTTNQQAYKSKIADFEDTKASVLGDYLPAKLGMDEGEIPVYAFLPGDYQGSLIYIFENGKVARITQNLFETKTNRKRLTGAYSNKSTLIACFAIREEVELALYTSAERMLILNTAMLAPKSTRDTIGVNVVTLKGTQRVEYACLLEQAGIIDPKRYRTKSIPAAGAKLLPGDARDRQLEMDFQ